jgi:hypothetical protein
MARSGARITTLILVFAVFTAASLAWPVVAGQRGNAASAALRAPAELCTTAEWQADFRACVDKLENVSSARLQCLDAPTPTTPDSGLAGWFASRPESALDPGPRGLYSEYGNAGYSFETYDDSGGCAADVIDPVGKAFNRVASAELAFATAIIGASNALRERAWDPRTMWAWADPLVEQATKAVYEKVFSVFGVITLCIVGIYLLWRSRQSDMSNAMTTAGWALLVMVAVTALAAWPVASANIADRTLIGTLEVVHEAVGPPSRDIPPDKCDDPGSCEDNRPPAVRAGDTATETMLYRHWLRGALGSADSETARRYGRALYDAKTLTWEETEKIRANPATRTATLEAKKNQWMKVAEQIRVEDPEAYEYLRGARDMDRIGAGFIALLAAILFAMFDFTASLLVLLGFLLFRWAVIAAPILGTIGLLRPASTGLRRLANAVVAAVFNIAIFGTGAAIYLFAVDLIMNTPALPGWLQVVLVFLTGAVGWLLLRPYRRITQLGGGGAGASGDAAWHRRFFREAHTASRETSTDPGERADGRAGRRRQVMVEQPRLRPEARMEDPSHNTDSRPEQRTPVEDLPTRSAAPRPRRQRPGEWTRPDVPEERPSYAIYRPDSAEKSKAGKAAATPRVRAEAR